MAIAQTTISKSAGWARTDVIDQLEQAFTWLEWHGDTRTGWISGISSYFGGGTVSNNSNYEYYDVFPSSTTGIGTGASFYVRRSGANINAIYINRPGYGYTGGEIVTISGEDIGGFVNGATNVQIKVAVEGTVNNAVGYAISFGGDYVASGTDRNGVVSGANTTITIKEGDTLTITNFNSFSSYQVNICWRDDITASDLNRVFNVINQNATTGGGVCTWRPLPGQRGTYFIKDDNFSAPTTTIVVTAADPADINYTGVGSTTSFYDKDTTVGGTNPWGVLRHEIQPNKKFGNTYRSFQVNSDTLIKFHVGSDFHPTDESTFAFNNQYSYNIFNGGAAYPNRFAGNHLFDIPTGTIFSSYYFRRSSDDFGGNYQANVTYANTRSYQLDLNIFRSTLDPKFAVLSFRHPTLSSLRLRDNTYATFILHNFTTNIWDLNDLFLSGVTFIEPSTNDSDPFLRFRSFLAGNFWNFNNNGSYSKRSAEFGYLTYASNSSNPVKDTFYRPNSYPQYSAESSVGIYLRDNSASSNRGNGGYWTGSSYLDSLPSSTNYNAVIKGIPINNQLVPCPYYLPDDFVLIDFDYATPGANIQEGDTITISPSEIYTVINGSYNTTTRTRGILFCARTV